MVQDLLQRLQELASFRDLAQATCLAFCCRQTKRKAPDTPEGCLYAGLCLMGQAKLRWSHQRLDDPLQQITQGRTDEMIQAGLAKRLKMEEDTMCRGPIIDADEGSS
mmetsp:Transcript_40322/g.72400  ORF Transcript_40322/g.72400 Transcript_40322/m.72400 type:complete len:107 (-) Transcript_40322:636-956(-)